MNIKAKIQLFICAIIVIQYSSNLNSIHIPLNGNVIHCVICFFIGYVYIFLYAKVKINFLKIKLDIIIFLKVILEEIVWRGYFLNSICMLSKINIISIVGFMILGILFVACHDIKRVKKKKIIEMIIFSWVLQLVALYNIIAAIFFHYGRNIAINTIKTIDDL